jgi:hypothetical protein
VPETPTNRASACAPPKAITRPVTKEAPSNCCRAEAAVYADEKEVGGEKEEEFVDSQIILGVKETLI